MQQLIINREQVVRCTQAGDGVISDTHTLTDNTNRNTRGRERTLGREKANSLHVTPKQ